MSTPATPVSEQRKASSRKRTAEYRQRQKEADPEAFAEKQRESARRYYARHREKVIARVAEHRRREQEADPEGFAEKHRLRQYRWRENNREHYLAKAKENRDRRVAVAREFIREYKTSHPCVDCGGFFQFMCMDFDHIGTDKKYNVGTLVGSGANVALIQSEMAKCELVCANCHRIRTYDRRIAERDGLTTIEGD